MPRRRNNELSLKEKAFTKEYIKNGGNGTQAALKAFNVKSRENAKATAYKVLKRHHVKLAIDEILNSKGLTLEDLSRYSQQIITKGITEGKPSFAAASNMIQFGYKLHNVIPATKSVVAKIDLRQDLQAKTPQELTEMLEKIQAQTTQLLEDIKK